MEKICTNTQRVNWIDCAKGIAILLTLVGHTLGSETFSSFLRGAIYSFHMPLFFILSCITYKYASDYEQLKCNALKSAKHILLPAIIVFLINTIWQCIQEVDSINNADYWLGKLYTFIFASGLTITFNGMEIVAMGIPWFFFAMFIGRLIFDYMHLVIQDDSKLLILSCIVGMLGVIIGKVQVLPFSMDIALAVLPFLYVGYYLKNHPLAEVKLKNVGLSLVVWMVTFFMTFTDFNNQTYLELAIRRYNLFPICYISAVAGTLFVGYFSLAISRFEKLMRPLTFVGKYSLYFMCIHAVDEVYMVLWKVHSSHWITTVKRMLIDVVVLVVFVTLKKLFFDRKIEE